MSGLPARAGGSRSAGDRRQPEIVAEEIRECVEGPGDARITDLHVWRVGPGAHAAIVAVKGIDAGAVRSRLRTVDEIAHLMVEHRL